MRVALVHDYLNQYGGAERVLEALHNLYPDAPIYTSMYAPSLMPVEYRKWDVRVSYLQSMPGIHRHHQPYLPLYPSAFGRFRLSGYDLVFSSSSAFAKGVRVPAGTMHICYCHSPMRFVWDFERYAARERLASPVQRALPFLLQRLRDWDIRTARRVDHFIANSTAVARRINEYWGRDAAVIYPPVETFARTTSPTNTGDYFMMISRLVHYKRFDIVIDAFNQLRLPLKIVGTGRAQSELERRAGPTIEFLGRVSDEEKFRLYADCRAAIFPAEDDFGIAQVEVQAAGRPAIALNAGGAIDTVVDGKTGILFEDQTVDSLIQAIRRFEVTEFSTDEIIRHAERFSRSRFEREIAHFVNDRLAERNASDQVHRIAEANVSWS